MPSHLKAMVVVIVLGAIVFMVAKAPACAVASAGPDYERRRNLWFALTLAAFLAHDFWIFIVVAAVLLLVAASREQNKLAMYFLLLFAVPMIPAQIPGLGIVQHLFTVNYARVLALAVLLPAYLELRRRSDTEPFGRLLCDKVLLAYLALQFLLMLSVSTFTNSLRHGVFYAFIDVFLPYYVASRALRSVQSFRDALMAFVVAALVLAPIAVFEMQTHWLLYAALDDALGTSWGYGRYLERDVGILRAQATAGQPIPLGYVMAVAIGFGLYLKAIARDRTLAWLAILLLVAGLVAPISRGPWIGALAIVAVFVATGAQAWRKLAALAATGGVFVLVLLATSGDDSVKRFLPFIGDVETENISYRQRLLQIAIAVILERPLFGAYDYIYSPAFMELRTGSAGFIDIVNTYVGVGLSSGLVGLALFASFFVAAAVGVAAAMRRLKNEQAELHVLGQALLATLVGILLIIFTTSSITVIPLVYWATAGMCVAYASRVRALAELGARPPEAVSRDEGRRVFARP